MTSTPEFHHDVPSPESGDAAQPESAETDSLEEQPVEADQSHASQPHAPQPAPEPTTPSPQELALALAALDEIAPTGAVGEVQGALAEGGAHGQAQVVAIRHASQLAGYPDWSWTVLLSRGLEGGPTVLEVALLPGDTSLLSPAWVPWSERLADYLAAKDAGAEDELDDEDELESDLEADLEDDFDDDFDVDEAVGSDDGDRDDDDDDDDDWGDASDAESDSEPDDIRR
ncbi:DUF3027 domain-containing protein [Agrococcus sp. ARC_14]|uniref:DUF3027 domain-containing protein n=1 Tax=Agrococcus sp. ARC_14 TaxID=2919927 RepID=UPI001F0651B4|nr:DUF3027 domain-containing protein [Agrococcus sp. ARC_14]MCH1884352.1 DUF3027 domain-containing protein [Agrococcus sp. ARC_14]